MVYKKLLSIITNHYWLWKSKVAGIVPHQRAASPVQFILQARGGVRGPHLHLPFCVLMFVRWINIVSN